jgi:hypothetical protein
MGHLSSSARSSPVEILSGKDKHVTLEVRHLSLMAGLKKQPHTRTPPNDK